MTNPTERTFGSFLWALGALLLIIPINLLSILIWIVRIVMYVLAWLGHGLAVMQIDLLRLGAWMMGRDTIGCGDCDACRAAEAARRERGYLSDDEEV